MGAYLAEAGKFVLIVDLDPQANATSGIGVDHAGLERGVYGAVLGKWSMRDIVQPTAHETLGIAPATKHLAGLNVELVDMPRREFKLYDALLEIKRLRLYFDRLAANRWTHNAQWHRCGG